MFKNISNLSLFYQNFKIALRSALVYDFKVIVGKRQVFRYLTRVNSVLDFTLNPYSTHQFLFVPMTRLHREVAVTIALFLLSLCHL